MQTLLHAAAMVPASIPSPDWSGFDIPLPWGSPHSAACRSAATEDCINIDAPATALVQPCGCY
jgi:hypothetical protein